MKVGVLTEINSTNYGGMLQGFALVYRLKKFGVDAEQINFWCKPNNKGLWGSFAKSTTLIGWGVKFFELAKKLKSFEAATLWVKRMLQSKAFLDIFVPLSKEVYPTTESLQRVKGYDLIFAGSDQIWNPWHFAAPNPFLMHNIKGCRKVAYAASIGVPQLPENRIEEYREAFTEYAAISLREYSNVPEIQALALCPVTAILDPSLLLTAEEWKDLLHIHAPRIQADVCVYWLGDLEKLVEIARILKAQGKTLCVYSEPTILKKKIKGQGMALDIFKKEQITYCIDAGPTEFLGAIVSAQAVVSDSFHAMMFSAIFKKPCQIITQSASDRQHMGIRMHDFLTLYATNSPCVETIGEVEAFPIIQLNAAYEEARKDALTWLRLQLACGEEEAH